MCCSFLIENQEKFTTFTSEKCSTVICISQVFVGKGSLLQNSIVVIRAPPRTPLSGSQHSILSTNSYVRSSSSNFAVLSFSILPSACNTIKLCTSPAQPWKRTLANDQRQVTMASTATTTPPEAQHSPTTPTSPTASFYDLSDDEEGEYNTIMHSRSGRGVKLLFSKSKVSLCAISKSCAIG